jgi:5-methylcytosine-specific restriction endonuclease McrA
MRLKESVAKTLELRRTGFGYREIAKQLNIELHCVVNTCKRYGLRGQAVEQRLTESQVADYVSRSGFTYVSGYQSQKKPVVVRCRDCGRTFERTFHVFRDVANGTWKCNNECPLCRSDRLKEEQERKQAEKKAERERDARIKAEQRAIKQADLISRQLEERLAIHVCKNCGTEYCIETTGYNSKQYCSEKCMKRWVMRIKNDRRIRRMKTRQHDTDITLELLFKKDDGVCYLCGKQCDWNDVDADGNAQGNYPSIDHVRPLSKGGTHTWNNVRLACRSCNNAKGSRF